MPTPNLNTNDIDQLRTQFRSWMDGVFARLNGIHLSNNPHRARSAAGDAWENAWETVDDNLDIKKERTDEVERLQSRKPKQLVWEESNYDHWHARLLSGCYIFIKRGQSKDWWIEAPGSEGEVFDVEGFPSLEAAKQAAQDWYEQQWKEM